VATRMRDEQSIERVRRSIATVPWERLAHAYHGASDAPANLEVFLSSTASNEELRGSIDWMWASILHQGSIYSASTPVLWILIDLLAAWPEHPAAESILRGVQAVIDVIPQMGDSYDEECGSPAQQNRESDPVYEAWVCNPLPTESDDAVGNDDYFKACTVTKRQLQALIRHSIPVIRASLNHSDGATRTAAVAAGLGALQVMPQDAAPLIEVANVIGSPQFDPGAWVSAAMMLGELGHDFSTLLAHSDRRMRLAAAMSSSTLHDPRSVAELASALSEPEWLEAEFPGGAAHLDMHLRFHVLTVLLDRVKAGDAENTVVEAICTLIHKRARPFTVDMEWGRVLHWAFAERIVSLPHKGEPAPLPDAPTQTQLAILQALCDKTELWDPKNGNASLAFKRVQLPFDRPRLRRLTGDRKRRGLLDLFRP
jgi:hypothetical protein